VGSANGATAFLPDGQVAEIPVGDTWASAQAGSAVLLPGLLRTTGILDVVLQHVTAAVADVVGPAAAERLRAEGIERLHEVGTPEQLQAMIDLLDDRLRRIRVGFPLERTLVSITAPELRNRYFASERVLVRPQVPRPDGEDGTAASGGRFVGRVDPLIPHRDTDFTSPRWSVSYWAALGRVQTENSVALYLDEADGAEPIIPVLDAGDVLVFAARTFHATIPNPTDETRAVVSFRIAPGRFVRYSREGTNFHPFTDARIASTPFAPAATLQSYVTAAAVRSWWTQHRPRR
jgi:hypothetical protein